MIIPYREIGMVFQANLFGPNVLENTSLQTTVLKHDRGLQKVAENLEKISIGSQYCFPSKQLSGGQQRVPSHALYGSTIILFPMNQLP